MRIERIELVRVPLALTPYEIAYDVVDSAENLFLQVVTDGPHVGLGCAAPDPSVTGETVDASLSALVGLDLVGADPLARMAVLHDVIPLLHSTPAARAGLDMALFDLLGKAAGLPVRTLLGGQRERILTSVTVFIDAPDLMAARARELVSQGFRSIKLKGGKDVDADIEAVRRTRREIGDEVTLRFDANQGYDTDQAMRFAAAIGPQDLELFEQPTPRGRPHQLARVTQDSAELVVADESVVTPAEVLDLAARRGADVVNVKLMKVGGLEAGLAIGGVLRASGLAGMVGCGDESALAIAAGLALALARPVFEYADLDGHLDLLDDPAAHAVVLQDGHLSAAPGPGFGVARLPSVFG